MTIETTDTAVETPKPKDVKPKKTKPVADENINYDAEIKTLKRDITALRKHLTEVKKVDAFFEYVRVRNVNAPTRGTEQSAGIDFYVPNDFPTTDLKPHEDVLIPSGIKVKIPNGTALIFKNKSGVATKLKLGIGAEVVDSDYQGEIHLHLINTSSKITRISAGMKITQALLIPYYNVSITEKKSVEDMYGKVVTERGTGGFGSTNQPKPAKSVTETPKADAAHKQSEPGIYEIWMGGYTMGNDIYQAEYIGKTEAGSFNEACAKMYTKNDKIDPRFSADRLSYMGIPLFSNREAAAQANTKLF